ncbi:MAG TPA: hypothetical protein VJJ72_01115 [Candidatus Paceibacterota bacterium]
MTLRQAKLLEFIIKQYVKTAQPVASDIVADGTGLELSPATIRNEMKELEDSGYLSQLHTSAGRVPTDKAYRWFVNDLLNTGLKEPSHSEKRKIQATFGEAQDMRQLAKSIATVLSELSDNLVITRIDESEDSFKSGLAGLFGMPEFREIDRIFNVTSFFEEFDNIFEAIEREFFGIPKRQPNFAVFIGRENPFRQIRDEAVILARYPLPGRLSGTLTLVGPTRMDYGRNLSLVKYTLDQLNNPRIWKM